MASQNDSGQARTLKAFGADALALDLKAFAARYGEGFLLQTTTRALASPETTSTEVLLDDGGNDDIHSKTADLSIVVHCLESRGDGHLVTLGRGHDNDVVISDPSISRFHAFAKRDAEAGFVIQDAGSTNGTTANGVNVPMRGVGPPAALRPGTTVRLGQVEFTFTDAAGLHSFAGKAAA